MKCICNCRGRAVLIVNDTEIQLHPIVAEGSIVGKYKGIKGYLTSEATCIGQNPLFQVMEPLPYIKDNEIVSIQYEQVNLAWLFAFLPLIFLVLCTIYCVYQRPSVEEVPLLAAQPEDLGMTCAVCFDEFQEFDMLRVLQCKHKFHQMCLDEWLQEGSGCPLCRIPVPSPNE